MQALKYSLLFELSARFTDFLQRICRLGVPETSVELPYLLLVRHACITYYTHNHALSVVRRHNLLAFLETYKLPVSFAFNGRTDTRTKSASFVEQIRPTCSQVYDLRTPISVFLQPRAFGAVVCIGDT